MAEKQTGNKSKVDGLKFMKKLEKVEEKQKEHASRNQKPIPTGNIPMFFTKIQAFVEKMPETTEAQLYRNIIDQETELSIQEPTRYKY
jgi:hypothetical protein